MQSGYFNQGTWFMLNHFELLLAFFEGVALIASPCILPILPLILSSSIDGGRQRPFGIIIGFILAFTLFALVSRELIALFNIDLTYIKFAALLLLSAFGVMLLSERLMSFFNRLTQGLSTSSESLSRQAQEGFLSGIFIGVLIGFVWTPCAGPILAIALVQVIRQQTSDNAVGLIIAFTLGVGLPMLLISLLGRQLTSKLSFLSKHSGIVRKILGVFILIAVVFIASGARVPTLASTDSTKSFADRGSAYPAPAFAASDQWFNTPNNQPLTIAALKNKVVLVDFWTYSCINCLRTLPYLNTWYANYHDKGLVIVGVHAPEFEFEKNPSNVQKAIARYQILYPVAMDNHLDTWTNYDNQYWPAHYLISKTGEVVYTHFGEGAYQETENTIRQLLGIKQAVVKESTFNDVNDVQTPETYLGYERSKAFASPERSVANISQFYTLPSILPMNHWALAGQWSIQAQRIVSKQADAQLRLHFSAKHVYLVLGSATGKPIDVLLTLNGQLSNNSMANDVTDGHVWVQSHRLYELVYQPTVSQGLLEIHAKQAGLEAYAFTFG